MCQALGSRPGIVGTPGCQCQGSGDGLGTDSDSDSLNRGRRSLLVVLCGCRGSHFFGHFDHHILGRRFSFDCRFLSLILELFQLIGEVLFPGSPALGVMRKARTSGNQAADDDVLLEAAQIVFETTYGSFRENTRGLLE